MYHRGSSCSYIITPFDRMTYSLGSHSYTRSQFAKELSPLGYRYPDLSPSHDSFLWGLDNYVDDILSRSRAQTKVRDSFMEDLQLDRRLARATSEIRDQDLFRRARSEIRDPGPAFSYKTRAKSEAPPDPQYKFLSQGFENYSPWSTTGGYYYPSCPHWRSSLDIEDYLGKFGTSLRSEIAYNLEIPNHLRWREGDLSTSLEYSLQYPESYRGTSSTFSPHLGRYYYYWESPSRYHRFSEYPFKYGYPTYPTRYHSSSAPRRYSHYPRYQSRFYR